MFETASSNMFMTMRAKQIRGMKGIHKLLSEQESCEELEPGEAAKLRKLVLS